MKGNIVNFVLLLGFATVWKFQIYTMGAYNAIIYQDLDDLNSNDNLTSKAPHRENINSITSNNNRNIITNSVLLKYLKGISGSETISGLSFEYDDYSPSEYEFQTVLTKTGVLPGIVTHMMVMDYPTHSQLQTFTNNIISDWNNGYLVNVAWIHWTKQISSKLDFTTNFDELRWRDLIEDGGSLNGEWKEQLDKIAPYLLQLPNAGVVPLCDLLYNINIKSNDWKGRPGINGSLKMFQITRDYLTTRHGLHSLIWSWAIWLQESQNVSQLEDHWPGDNYVDVVTVTTPNREMTMIEYEKLLMLVGDKPIGMEYSTGLPSIHLFATQSRWSWFFIRAMELNGHEYRNRRINDTFYDVSVINKGAVNVFKNSFAETSSVIALSRGSKLVPIFANLPFIFGTLMVSKSICG